MMFRNLLFNRTILSIILIKISSVLENAYTARNSKTVSKTSKQTDKQTI